MATSTVVPVGEYLRTLYRPDCDYVDGEIQERLFGERDHSLIQGVLLHLLDKRDDGKQCKALPSLRVKIHDGRYHVVDVCVLSGSAPREKIVMTPPLLCLEVIESVDTILRMRAKVRDYLGMGVLEVWLVNPSNRVVTVCKSSTMTDRKSGELTVPGTPVTISVHAIFSVLDEI